MQPAYLSSYKHWASLVAQSVKNPPAMQENWVRSLGQEDPLEKIWQPTAEFSPEESHGQRSLVGNSPWGCEGSDTTERLIAAHSTINTLLGSEDPLMEYPLINIH